MLAFNRSLDVAVRQACWLRCDTGLCWAPAQQPGKRGPGAVAWHDDHVPQKCSSCASWPGQAAQKRVKECCAPACIWIYTGSTGSLVGPVAASAVQYRTLSCPFIRPGRRIASLSSSQRLTGASSRTAHLAASINTGLQQQRDAALPARKAKLIGSSPQQRSLVRTQESQQRLWLPCRV